MTVAPAVKWNPPSQAWEKSRVGDFASWLAVRRGVYAGDYESLREWSVEEPESFWQSIVEYFDVHFTVPWERVRTDDPMPETRWFTGSKLNYAEHMLRHTGPRPALYARSHTRDPFEVSFDELRDQVARARVGLRSLGVGPGDRVVAYAPNIPETLVAFLATASLGAIWASCSPEFGARSVIDRFSQIEPTVLLTVDGYKHNEKIIDRAPTNAEIAGGLPTLRHVITVAYLSADCDVPEMGWAEVIGEPGPLEFEPVDFAHPLYVLFSSGTTGLPKPIVHGHGGITVEHLKFHGLHGNLGPGDTLFQPATTAWMVWNSMISALMQGAALILFDGDVTYPDLAELWRVAASAPGVSNVGAAAMLLEASARADLSIDGIELPALRVVSSTGSPLGPEGYDWVYRRVGNVIVSSQSGGTDVCAAFVGGVPVLPVVAGEITCRMLGVAVEAYDPEGRSLIGERGELVITAAMPSMPVGFWGDEDRTRYRQAYFSTYEGVWRHGDWITITERGTAIISGRSDATLNRGGVRLGTSEFYSVVDTMSGVADSVVVHVDVTGTGGRLVLLVATQPGTDVDELAAAIRHGLKKEQSPRHSPEAVYFLSALPRTLTGKKLEVPIKRILDGSEPSAVLSADAISHPEALAVIAGLAGGSHDVDRDLRRR